MILRGLDGVLKLADVVARTNLSKENIVKLAKDNIIMARFTDFDLDAVFQEAEGDDDGGDDISRRIGQLSLEMRNVMGRIEGVERSQLGLQRQVTEIDNQTSSRFEQMLQVVADQKRNLAEQNKSVREFMEQWNRPDSEYRQQGDRLQSGVGPLHRDLREEPGRSRYDEVLLRGVQERSSSTLRSRGDNAYAPISDMVSLPPPFSNAVEPRPQLTAAFSHAASGWNMKNEAAESEESSEDLEQMHSSGGSQVKLHLDLASDHHGAGLGEETERKKPTIRGPRLPHAESKRRKRQPELGELSEVGRHRNRQSSVDIQTGAKHVIPEDRISRHRSSSEEVKPRHRSRHTPGVADSKVNSQRRQSGSVDERHAHRATGTGHRSHHRSSSEEVKSSRRSRHTSSTKYRQRPEYGSIDDQYSRREHGRKERPVLRSLLPDSDESSDESLDRSSRDKKYRPKSRHSRRSGESRTVETRHEKRRSSGKKVNVSRISTSESSLSESSDSDDGRRRKRAPPFPKLPTFDGKTSEWPGFIFQFRRLAQSGKWTTREKRDRLLGCLRGKAIAYVQSRPKAERKDYYALKSLLNMRYGILEEPTIARRHLQSMRQEEAESLEDFADRVLVKAAEGYPEIPDDTLQSLAVDNFLRGCRDRGAAYVAVEKKPDELQTAVQMVREAAVNLKLYGRSGGLIARQVTFRENDTGSERSADGKTKEQKALISFLEELFQTKTGSVEKRSTASSPVRNRSPSPARCYKCQDTGHRSRDCNKIPVCFKCGKSGHISTECQGIAVSSGQPEARSAADQGEGNHWGVDQRAI